MKTVIIVIITLQSTIECHLVGDSEDIQLPQADRLGADANPCLIVVLIPLNSAIWVLG